MREERIGDAVLYLGDCRAVLATLEPDSFDSVVCDPPYELAFMGRKWDSTGVAFQPETWAAVYRVLKPGAHLVAFGGTRTVHRMACAIEDAGFEIRDSLMWLYGSGFPKSLDVSKAIDKAAGAEREVVGVKPGHEQFADRKTRGHIDFKNATDGFDRPWMHDDERRAAYHQLTAPATEAARQWQGWGTALKPAHEPIILARKPLAEKTVAANVLTHGVGAINVDATRVATPRDRTDYGLGNSKRSQLHTFGKPSESADFDSSKGRWPSNVLHDGSPEVLEAFARFGEKTSGKLRAEVQRGSFGKNGIYGKAERDGSGKEYASSTGTAARFFPDLGFSQDAPKCLLCCKPISIIQPCTNAKTVAYSSTTQSIQTGDFAACGAQDFSPLVSEDNKSRYLFSVEPAELSSAPSQATPSSSALRPAPALERSSLAQVAKDAAPLCDSCATAFAQKFALVSHNQDPASHPIPGSISARNEQILNHSLALHVEGRRQSDTTRTIQSLKMLFGSVSSAIADTISLERNESSESIRSGQIPFFYSGKSSRQDRAGSTHPTIKPQALMRWLCRLVTPPGGHVLDCFAGSGSTLQAARAEGFRATGIELTPEYFEDIKRRLATKGDDSEPGLFDDLESAPKQQVMAL